jgi:hypothetical protein
MGQGMGGFPIAYGRQEDSVRSRQSLSNLYSKPVHSWLSFEYINRSAEWIYHFSGEVVKTESEGRRDEKKMLHNRQMVVIFFGYAVVPGSLLPDDGLTDKP